MSKIVDILSDAFMITEREAKKHALPACIIGLLAGLGVAVVVMHAFLTEGGCKADLGVGDLLGTGVLSILCLAVCAFTIGLVSYTITDSADKALKKVDRSRGAYGVAVQGVRSTGGAFLWLAKIPRGLYRSVVRHPKTWLCAVGGTTLFFFTSYALAYLGWLLFC